ncbi:MAG TPA: MFS transporter [Anaerolineae bacterium]|nr:MFS transporter [Anaerolineae bacterium]HQI86446.1 MFS transporter [Anaerolineae bacterium]
MDLKQYYTLKRKILLSLISGGSALVTVIVGSSFMKFYTDIVGLSPALYGVVFFIFSIWNGINDPIIGYWADKRPFLTGRGKYRPLIRWSIPAIGVSVIALLFASPDWGEIVTAVYLLILLVIYEGFQTVLGVSYMAFTVNTFLATDERTEMQVISSYVNMIPVFLGGMIPVWFLTGEYSRMSLVAIFSGAFLFGLLLIWIGSQFIRENKRFYETMEVTQGLKELLALARELFRDKTFAIFIAAFFLIQAATGNYFSGYLYYMDNVLEVSGLQATIPDVLTGVGQMATFPLIVLAVRKFGSKETLWKGLLIAVAGHAMLSLPINYWIAAGTYIVILLGYGFSSAINAPIGGLIVDHIELKTGKRQPGVVRGIMAILMVPASSLQPLILSALLSATGYVGGSKSQSLEVVRAIRLGTGIIPAVILLIGIGLLILLPINHKRELEIQAAVEEKHGAKLELV